VPGTGGIRNALGGRQGTVNMGGVPVIYYFWISDDEIYLIQSLFEDEQADMKAAP